MINEGIFIQNSGPPLTLSQDRAWFTEVKNTYYNAELELELRSKEISFGSKLPIELYMTHTYKLFLKINTSAAVASGRAEPDMTVISEIQVLDCPSLHEEIGIIEGVRVVSLSDRKRNRGILRLKFKESNYLRKNAEFFCLRISCYLLFNDGAYALLISKISAPFKVYSKKQHTKIKRVRNTTTTTSTTAAASMSDDGPADISDYSDLADDGDDDYDGDEDEDKDEASLTSQSSGGGAMFPYTDMSIGFFYGNNNSSSSFSSKSIFINSRGAMPGGIDTSAVPDSSTSNMTTTSAFSLNNNNTNDTDGAPGLQRQSAQ